MYKLFLIKGKYYFGNKENQEVRTKRELGLIDGQNIFIKKSGMVNFMCQLGKA